MSNDWEAELAEELGGQGSSGDLGSNQQRRLPSVVKPPSRLPSKPPSVEGVSGSLFSGLSGDLGEDSGDFGAAPQRRAPAATKAPSKAPSRVPSKPPSVVGASGSLFSGLSGDLPPPSRQASIPASKPLPAAAPPASADASLDYDLSGEASGLFGPSRPPSRPASVLGGPRPANPTSAAATSQRPSPLGSERSGPAAAGPGPAPGAGPGSTASGLGSARPTPPGSVRQGQGQGRPASPSPLQSDDSYADLIPPSRERSAASLPGEPQRGASGAPSGSGSGLGYSSGPAAAAAGPGSTRLPSAPSANGGYTPLGTSRPASVASGAHSHGAAGGSGAGAYSPASSMGRGGPAPPEAAESPSASRVGAFNGGVGGSAARPSDKSRRLEVRCEIPTPFELFRLYDTNESGCITHDEFVVMLRDLDGHPDHYAPQQDPEHRLAGLRDRRKQLEGSLAAGRDKLLAAQIAQQEADAAAVELRQRIARAEAELGGLQAPIAREEAAAAKLALSPEARAERDKWRKWVQETYQQTDSTNKKMISMGQGPLLPSPSDPAAPIAFDDFADAMRRKDGHPDHYSPQQDPEHRLAGLRDRREKLDLELQGLRGRLSAAEIRRREASEAAGGLRKQAADAEASWQALDAQVRADEAEVKRLALTPEQKAERTKWRTWVEEEFRRADLAGNNILSVDEFYMYYYSKMCFRFPVLRTGVNPGALLFNIFVKYCSFGRGAVGGRNEDMLSHQFYKLCKDAGLINGKTVTKATVDIVYHRARAADESLETYKYKPGVAATARMYYPQFLFALDKIAEKRRSGFQEVVARLLSSVDTLPAPSFADFLLLSGHELEPGAEVPEYLTRPRPLPDNSKSLRALADNALIRKMKDESQDALKLSQGTLNPQAAYSGFRAFQAARDAAKQDDTSKADGADGADRGASGQGAPAPAAAADSASPAAAAAAAGTTVRGSVYGSLAPPSVDPEVLRRKPWELPEPTDLRQSRAAAARRGLHATHSPDTMHLVRGLDPDSLMVGLKRVFEGFAASGGGPDRGALDKARWGAALRGAGLVAESGPLPARRVDEVYARVLPASSKALNFLQFIEGLRHVAVLHRMALNEVMERLVAVGPPPPQEQPGAWSGLPPRR